MHLAHVAEKRAHPRIQVRWPVVLMTTEGALDGVIENISAGGAYINCGRLLFRNDLLILGILGLEREPLWIGAEVVRADIVLSADSGSVPVGMGVRFTFISEEDLRFLTDMSS